MISNRQLYYLKNKASIAAKKKIYQKTPKGTLSHRIRCWKHYGIISNDWKKTYNHYFNTHYCEFCDNKFKNSRDRHLDHDHNINDDINIRGVLCRSCNVKDVFNGYFDCLG